MSLVPADNPTDAMGEVVVDFPPVRPWRHHVGELRLMVAVLEDAINVLRKRPRSRAGREAREWLASNDTHWPFAFERICEALDLDADSVRHQVAQRPAVRVEPRPFEFAQFAVQA
jgi:hypothetical protein